MENRYIRDVFAERGLSAGVVSADPGRETGAMAWSWMELWPGNCPNCFIWNDVIQCDGVLANPG